MSPLPAELLQQSKEVLKRNISRNREKFIQILRQMPSSEKSLLGLPSEISENIDLDQLFQIQMPESHNDALVIALRNLLEKTEDAETDDTLKEIVLKSLEEQLWLQFERPNEASTVKDSGVAVGVDVSNSATTTAAKRGVAIGGDAGGPIVTGDGNLVGDVINVILVDKDLHLSKKEAVERIKEESARKVKSVPYTLKAIGPQVEAESPQPETKQLFSIEQHRFFSELADKQIWVGDTIILPILTGEAVTFKVSSTATRFNDVTVQVEEEVGLIVESWRKKVLLLSPTADIDLGRLPQVDPPWQVEQLDRNGTFSVTDENPWPSFGHHWIFELVDLTREFPLTDAEDVLMEFDRRAVKVAWRIWHKAEEKNAEQVLVLLGQ